MKRRDFIRLSTATVAAAALGGCGESRTVPRFEVRSAMQTGHLVRESLQWPQGDTQKVDVLVVGGGIAGLAAAYGLRDRHVVVCELADRLGGSSSSQLIGKQAFSQGAHYDLTYPDWFGAEGLQALEALRIIERNPYQNRWDFVDRQFLIPPDLESQTFDGVMYREDVLPRGDFKDRFIELMLGYHRQIPLPTRLIPSAFHPLNQLTFSDFLSEKIPNLPHEFWRALDYHMRDDFGGNAAEVSALAGVAYYASRSYWADEIQLFSPPQGNAYFVDKLAAQLPAESLLTGHLVHRIEATAQGFEVAVLDVANQQKRLFRARQVVYAGHKHALPHVFPMDGHLFKNNVYSPWVILNVALKKADFAGGFWQNETLAEPSNYLGFIDARQQAGEHNVLTAYYCFAPDEREWVAKVADVPEALVGQTMQQIGAYLGLSAQELVKKTEAVYLHLMGHAMPIPVPGHLLKDANQGRNNPHLVYAGVDNGRLPVFFEALDSGLQAAQLLRGI